MDDHAILADYAASGAEGPMGDLAMRYEPLIRAVALREGADADMAEDITQSAMVALLRKGKSLRSNRPLGAWLVRVTRYLTIDALRGKSARQRHERTAARERPEAATAARHVEAILIESLQQLGDSDRAILVSRYLDGRNTDEVARELGITSTAARQRLSRALGRLREILDRQGLREEDLLATLLAGLKSSQWGSNALGGNTLPERSPRLKFLVAGCCVVVITATSIWAWKVIHAAQPARPAAVAGSVLTAPPTDSRPDSTVP